MARKKIKAVSLMEILVAAMILSTAFAGLLAGFVSVRRYVSRANNRVIAANLARSQLNLVANNPSGAVAGTGFYNVDGKNFAMNRTVTPIVTPAGNYIQVDIDIIYPSD